MVEFAPPSGKDSPKEPENPENLDKAGENLENIAYEGEVEGATTDIYDTPTSPPLYSDNELTS